MNRAISGRLAVAETGRPLRGFLVLAAQVGAVGLIPLGLTESQAEGRFAIDYPRLAAPADLTVLIFDPATGGLLFTEPTHRAVAGAELRLDVRLPSVALETATASQSPNVR